VLSINAASAALHISKIPFEGPVGAVRVGLCGDDPVVHPPREDSEEADLELVIAGTEDAILMVEGQADEVSEDQMVQALEFGHEHIKRICETIEQLRSRVGQEKMEFTPPQTDPDVLEDVGRRTEGRF